MSIVFQPTKIGPLSLKNHIMRSPCVMNSCTDDGLMTKRLQDYYFELAKGEIGLVVPEMMNLGKEGKGFAWQASASNDEQVNSWKPVVDEFHKNNTKVVFQVGDSGLNTLTDYTGCQLRGPSAGAPGTRAITRAEIDELIEKFHNAAKRIQRIGVDGIQIHCAHNYLLSEFLSPLANHRDDEYGGSNENRRRIVQQIIDAIHSATDKNFAVLTKINGHDCREGGLVPSDVAETIAGLKGVDMHEISCGLEARSIIRSKPKNLRLKDYPLKPGYTMDYVRVIRERNPNAKLATVGGFLKLKDMEDALATGIPDLISIARPTISDPLFMKKLKEGKKPIACVSCGQCSVQLANGPVKCHVNWK